MGRRVIVTYVRTCGICVAAIRDSRCAALVATPCGPYGEEEEEKEGYALGGCTLCDFDVLGVYTVFWRLTRAIIR